jgi:arrestin-1
MVYALKVFKKTSPNSKVTVYLGKRDYIDNITKIESVGKHLPIVSEKTSGINPISYCADGVALIDPEYLKGRKLFGQIVCSFRYGREEDEVMGLEFQKDLLMASGEIRASQKSDLTKMQVKCIQSTGCISK